MPRIRIQPTSQTTERSTRQLSMTLVSARVAAAVVHRLEDATSALDLWYGPTYHLGKTVEVGLAVSAERAD